MSIPLVDRPPTESEIERFRLFLSSYQDRLGNGFEGEPVYPWIFRDVLRAAFNMPASAKPSEDKLLAGGPLVNPEANYQINLKSLFCDELEDFCKKNLVHSLSPSSYWDHASQFGITRQNYRENALQVGIAAIDCLRDTEKTECEKLFYLFLFVNLDSYISKGSEKGISFYLAQYPYSIDSYCSNPSAIHWIVSEEKDSDIYLHFGGIREMATYFRGYENDELLIEIKIPEDEPAPAQRVPAPNRKRQKVTVKSLIDFGVWPYASDHSIKIRLFFPSSRIFWHSNILQIEKLSKLQIMEYGAIAAIKKQREEVIAQLEELINSDAREEEFQQLLEKNWWMFGNEYGEVLGQREIAAGMQQDFLAKRTADGFLEILEIKKPLNGKSLIYRTNQGSHARSHYRQELSDAIAQVIDYIDEVEYDKRSLYYKEKLEVEKIRAKIIVGRDGDERQKRSLRHLNSTLHGIEILTYDQLLRIAKKSLEYQ